MTELDLTKHGFRPMAHWIPDGLWWTFLICLLMGLMAWAIAWRHVRRSAKAKDLEVFIAFPITHLFFMPVFLFRDWKHARMSLMIYFGIFIVWVTGGQLTLHHEQSKLEAFQTTMRVQDESHFPTGSKKIFNDSDSQNIWAHPVLLPLVIMGEDSERGESLRGESSFGSWLPPQSFRMDLKLGQSIRKDLGKELNHLYSTSASIVHAKTPSLSLSNKLGAWSEVGLQVIDYFNSHENDFASLGDALKRPVNFFPKPDQNGLHVHLHSLSLLKQISQAIRLRSSALLVMGESDASHRAVKLGLMLAKAGAYDSGVSLMFQVAQTHFAISPLEIAQMFHCWDDSRWGEIDDLLRGWNLIEASHDAVLAERAFLSNFVEPLLKQSTTENLAYLRKAGVIIRGLPNWMYKNSWPFDFHLPFNWMTAGFSRSLVIKQWIAYLRYTNHTMILVEKHIENREGISWSKFEKEMTDPDVPSQGYITTLWGLDSGFFEKLFTGQSKIRTARIGIALERYRIKTGQYPDSFAEFIDLYPDLLVQDAWSGESMLYERVGDDGFLLRMEDVNAAGKLASDLPHHWFVPSNIPPTPVFSKQPMLSLPDSNRGVPTMSVEMMKRYGLIPVGDSRPGSNDNQLPQNFRLFRNKIYIGGEPEGLPEFQAIKNLGIATIVSVDGANPDVKTARDQGMDYVHIPIGYDGINKEQSHSLVRVARELKRPIYVHCHHGRHRGPAAAALMCLEDGRMTLNQVISVMIQAGTSEDYSGLWNSVKAFKSPDKGVPLPELVEIAPVGDLVSAMAKIDRDFDRLQKTAGNDWQVPNDDPDINPAQLTLLLREIFHELARNLPENYEPAMREKLQQAEEVALSLENALKVKEKNAITRSFQQLKQSCNDCHSIYRDR